MTDADKNEREYRLRQITHAQRVLLPAIEQVKKEGVSTSILLYVLQMECAMLQNIINDRPRPESFAVWHAMATANMESRLEEPVE